MTVEEWINAHLETCIKEAEACVDDAIDEVAIANKQQREEIRNIQHARSVKSRSTKEILWDIAITIIGVGDDAAEHLEKQFVLRPYPRPDGMVRIGRSTSAEFEVPHGISLFFDPSVSVWHGKFTNVKNSIYYSDLHTRNGSIINGYVSIFLITSNSILHHFRTCLAI